jgi:WD40 repeat protein
MRFEEFICSEFLGKTSDFEEYKAYLQKRFTKLKKHMLLSNQKTFVQRLDSLLDDRKAWLNSIAQAVTGKTLETFSDEDEILLYEKFKAMILELDSLTKIKTFKAHDHWIRDIKLTTDHSKLISCSIDKKIKIWNLDTFKCIKVLDGHTNTIRFIDFSSNGNILSCSKDKTIKLWQIETGEMLKSIQFEHPILCVKALNEYLIVIGLENGEIQIYNFERLQIMKSIMFNSSFIKRIHFLSNSDIIVGFGNGSIKLVKIFE